MQELLAPEFVIFCDSEWQTMGFSRRKMIETDLQDLRDLSPFVSAISGIDSRYLTERNHRGTLSKVSIAERMSWAAQRTTTRLEDEAYCLLGLFGVNMPLLYGEGRSAFRRLQEELIKVSNDQSIFAWTPTPRGPLGAFTKPPTFSMLADSPRAFGSSGVVRAGTPCAPYELTNRGLRLVTEYIETYSDDFGNYEVLITFNCRVKGSAIYQTSYEEASSAQLIARTRKVFTVLAREEGSDQWVRCVLDDLGLATRFDDEDMATFKRLLTSDQWQPEATFFINAF